MKYLFGCLLATFAAVALPAFATSQEPDRLVLDGEKLSLETNPLSPLIRSGRIKLPEPDEHWSSNWRGYVATWKIEDDQLLLTMIEVLEKPDGSGDDAEAVAVNVLSHVFGGRTQVPADWFSGTFVVPRGELLKYVHMGYGSTYERYTILHISSGRVLSRRDLSAKEYEQLRRERFTAYQKTAEYAARFKDSRKTLSADSAEDFIYQFAVEEYMSSEP